MIWGLFWLVMSQISFGITNVLWKKPQEKTGTLSLIIARSFCTLLIFGIISLSRGDLQKLDFFLLSKIVFLCAINYFGLFFYLKSIKEKQVSEVLGLGKMGTIIGVLIGYFYYDEKISLPVFVAIVLSLLGPILIDGFLNRGKFKISKAFIFANLSVIFWSSDFFYKNSVQKVGPFLFSFILEVTVFSLSFILLKVNREELTISPLRNFKNEFSFLVILGFLGIYGSIHAVKDLPVTLFAMLGLLYPLTTFLVSRIYLKEKLEASQWIGIILGIIGSLLISMGY